MWGPCAPCSLAEFSTSLPSHGTEEIKPVNSFMFWGMVRTGPPVASQPKPALQAFVTLLAFELRMSPTTKACHRPGGNQGCLLGRKLDVCLGRSGSDSLYSSQTLGRKPDKNTLCSLLLFLSLVLRLTTYTFFFNKFIYLFI